MQRELLERLQLPAEQGGGERGAAGVGDLVVVEVQGLASDLSASAVGWATREATPWSPYADVEIVDLVVDVEVEVLERLQPAQATPPSPFQRGGTPCVCGATARGA